MMIINHGHAFPWRKRIGPTIAFLFLLISSCLLVSCDSDEDDIPVLPKILLQDDAALGKYLTDSFGRTLYGFANDFNGQNNCTGGCVNLWPVYYAGELTQADLKEGLDIDDFATIILTDGAKQTTYKTWPLYHYAPVVAGVNTPEPAGEKQGEGFAGFWHVAKPDYTIRLVNAQLIGNDGKNYTSAYLEGTGKTLYFTDARGLTLYNFSMDSLANNNFTAADFSNNAVWPLYETDQVVVPSTLDKTLFSSINVFGKTQLTYKGWPIYYFGADNSQRGSNKGVSVPVPGTWPVVVMDAPAAPAP